MDILSDSTLAFTVDGAGLGMASANPEENTVQLHVEYTSSDNISTDLKLTEIKVFNALQDALGGVYRARRPWSAIPSSGREYELHI